MKNLIYLILLIFIAGCNENMPKVKEEVVLSEEQIMDSIYTRFNKGIEIKNLYKYDEISLSSFSELKFSKKIQFQFSNDDYYSNYRYRTAERGKVFVYLTYTLKSKKSPNQLGIDMFQYKEKFLPLITVYTLDEKSKKIIHKTDLDEYDMMKKLPNEVSWMEDYFNYKEEGKMIMYKEVDEDIKKLKLLVSVKSVDGKKRMSRINLDGVIAIKK